MKKHLFNAVFYLICFIVVAGSIYHLSYAVPPPEGTPEYTTYFWGTTVVAVFVAVMVVLPNLQLEYWSHKDMK